jgi:hypothetical protein
MAIGTPSESPAIVTREVDLSGVVPNVQSTTGVVVGNFRWGPVNTPVQVSNETSLAANFGTPNLDTSVDFHSAAYFLRYSGDLRVIRGLSDSGQNAYAIQSQVADDVATKADITYTTDSNGSYTSLADILQITDRDNFDVQVDTLDAQGHSFIARWPGDIGSSLRVSICPPTAVNDSGVSVNAFDTWAYADRFDGAPSTSAFAQARATSNDELHIAVIDSDGLVSGTRGTILETFPFVSVGKNSRNPDGSSNYIKDVINNGSKYIWMAGMPNQLDSADNVTINASGDLNFLSGDVLDITFGGGANGSTLTAAEYATGFNAVSDVDTIQVDFLVAPGLSSADAQTTVVNNLVAIAQGTRKDCVVIASPYRGAVVGNADPVASTVTSTDGWTKSSYLFVDNNYLKVYDKYNDQYILIPAASSTAGIMAASDFNSAPWYSPAGQRRGNYLGITSLAYSPTKAERDALYKNGVNPIANIPGQGVLLFGDKTKLARPSAFDRINVRRLFLVVERAIALAARNVMFEFNDEFTRAEFVNVVEPFLRNIKGRRGITDFKVVCDDTNNTADVIDRNEFIANIFIKPARSINYVTLNFVAVRTGVDFQEVVGAV